MMKIKKFNESSNYDKSLEDLFKDFKDMFQEIEDDGVSVNMKFYVHNGDNMGKEFKFRFVESNWLYKCINLSNKSNSDIYAAFRYAFRVNGASDSGWLKSSKHPITEIINVILTKEKNYDNYDFFMSIGGDNLVELFILTDIIVMTKENLFKFSPLIEKGLDWETACINSHDSIEVGLFSGQLRGTILNLRGGNEIENPGLKRLFNNNYILDQNIIKLK